MKKILITGGTGFIGSHIASELLKQGHLVYFLSRSSTLTTNERVLRALTPLALPRKDRYEVIDCDLISPLDNLNLENIDEAWHCAASLSFKDEDEIETFAINVGGTKNFLALLTRIGVERLHFISTAYVSGDALNNPYEKSKAEAEGLVQKWATNNKGRVTIYRPSIVVGDSKTGFASKFDGYYTCARAIYLMRQFLEMDLRKNQDKYLDSGIRLDNDILHLPVAFPGFANTRINIIPIDLAVDAIMDCSSDYGTFHITNEEPPRLSELIEVGTKVLHIRGMYVGEPRDEVNVVLRQLNRKILIATEHYGPYLYGSNIKNVPGKSIKFPITEGFVSLILGYAKSVDFKGG